MIYGWKQVADKIGGDYHPDHVRRLFRRVRNNLPLKYWLGPRHRIVMTQEELEQFREIILVNVRSCPKMSA